MNVRLYGINQMELNIVTIKQADKLNVSNLIQTFESNLDKTCGVEWMERYKTISSIYNQMFRYGEIPSDMLEQLDFQSLQMAEENIQNELIDIVNKPYDSNGRDYYYEYGRSIGVEIQASKLKEFIDEECDFI